MIWGWQELGLLPEGEETGLKIKCSSDVANIPLTEWENRLEGYFVEREGGRLKRWCVEG